MKQIERTIPVLKTKNVGQNIEIHINTQLQILNYLLDASA